MPPDEVPALLRRGVFFFWIATPAATAVVWAHLYRGRGGGTLRSRTLLALPRSGLLILGLSILAGAAWLHTGGGSAGPDRWWGAQIFPAFGLLALGAAAVSVRASYGAVARAEPGSERRWVLGTIGLVMAGCLTYGMAVLWFGRGSVAENLFAVAAMGGALILLAVHGLGRAGTEGLRRIRGERPEDST